MIENNKLKIYVLLPMYFNRMLTRVSCPEAHGVCKARMLTGMCAHKKPYECAFCRCHLLLYDKIVAKSGHRYKKYYHWWCAMRLNII